MTHTDTPLDTSLKDIQANLDEMEDRHTKLTAHLAAIKNAHATYSKEVDEAPIGIETAKAMSKLNEVETYITECLDYFIDIMNADLGTWYDNINEDSAELINALAQIEAETEEDMDTITIDDETAAMVDQILMLIEGDEDAKAAFNGLISVLQATQAWKKNQ